jgi:sulfatase modifying factor 1
MWWCLQQGGSRLRTFGMWLGLISLGVLGLQTSACFCRCPLPTAPCVRAYGAPAPPPQATPRPAPRAVMDWVTLPGGRLGIGDGWMRGGPSPTQSKAVGSFALARSETTVAQYRACVDAGDCVPPRGQTYSVYGNYRRSDRENHPVNYISWFDAQRFCRWVGGRLPTSDEWEYAARSGGRLWKFPWGNAKFRCQMDVMGGSVGGARCRTLKNTSPVCTHPQSHSRQGICNMIGNVSEWVARSPGDMAKAPGPLRRMRMGASYNSRNYRIDAGFRVVHSHGKAHTNTVGFRCARDVR